MLTCHECYKIALFCGLSPPLDKSRTVVTVRDSQALRRHYNNCDLCLPLAHTEQAIAAPRTWRMQKLRKSSMIRESVGCTQVGSSSIHVEEVAVAGEDRNPAIRMGTVTRLWRVNYVRSDSLSR
jgi:hypothetical protein